MKNYVTPLTMETYRRKYAFLFNHISFFFSFLHFCTENINEYWVKKNEENSIGFNSLKTRKPKSIRKIAFFQSLFSFFSCSNTSISNFRRKTPEKHQKKNTGNSKNNTQDYLEYKFEYTSS